MSTERGRVLDGVLDRLSGGRGEDGVPPSPSTPASPAQPVGPLRWADSAYGPRYTRDGAPEPVDVFGKPFPAPPIGVGWTVFSLTQVTSGGQQRCGVVVDVSFDTYLCVDNYRNDVRRVDINRDDVAEAVSPSRPVLESMCRSIWRQLGDEKRRGSRSHRDWLETAAHRLAALAANT